MGYTLIRCCILQCLILVYTVCSCPSVWILMIYMVLEFSCDGAQLSDYQIEISSSFCFALKFKGKLKIWYISEWRCFLWYEKNLNFPIKFAKSFFNRCISLSFWKIEKKTGFCRFWQSKWLSARFCGYGNYPKYWDTFSLSMLGKSLSCLHFNPSLADHDMPCLSKQCRSRSLGFFRSQLIWICTVCH